MFEMEWPPRSGRRQTFPELDRAACFDISEARQKILYGQAVFLELLPVAILALKADKKWPAEALNGHPEALREELSVREGFIASDKLIKTTSLPFHRQRGFSVGLTKPVVAEPAS
jgi:hypothetical protein